MTLVACFSMSLHKPVIPIIYSVVALISQVPGFPYTPLVGKIGHIRQLLLRANENGLFQIYCAWWFCAGTLQAFWRSSCCQGEVEPKLNESLNYLGAWLPLPSHNKNPWFSFVTFCQRLQTWTCSETAITTSWSFAWFKCVLWTCSVGNLQSAYSELANFEWMILDQSAISFILVLHLLPIDSTFIHQQSGSRSGQSSNSERSAGPSVLKRLGLEVNTK